MKFNFKLVFLSILTLILASCQDKGEVSETVSVIKVENNVLKVGDEGGSIFLTYTSVGKAYGKTANVETDVEWININTTTTTLVELSIEKNDTGADRNAKVILSGHDASPVTVHVIQSKVSDAKPVYNNFNVTISKITSSAACIEVDPVNPTAYYYTDLFQASTYDTYGESYLVKSMMENIINTAAFYGIEDPRVLLYQGYFNTDYNEDISLDLRDDTDYYVGVVDMDVDESGNLTTSGKGEFHKFHTLKPSQVEMTFSFEIKGTQVEVTPSADYTYICGLAAKSQWDTYKNPSDAARDYIAIAKQYSMLETIVYTGKRTVDFSYLLESSGDYVVYAVGYRNTSGDKGLTTDIQYRVFTYSAK